ncbi:MAG: hypothetical protein QOD32_3429 [Pyrinomonadaceae bacterium]|jgi:hypothetical protein|nr:hypothetical protein [Pyrinomonadaceae bacterium]
MSKSLRSIFVACVLTLAAATAGLADIRLKLKTTHDAHAGESRIYIKGRRQRNEFKGTRPDGTQREVAVIFQCDLGRQIVLDPATRVVYEYPYVGREEFFARAEAASAKASPPKSRPEARLAGRIVETFTVTDTGERREMFGYTARRIKTTLTWEIAPASCPIAPLRRETDGWYVDLLYGTFCSYDISGADESELLTLERSKCAEHYLGGDPKRRYGIEHKQVGTARFGYPLALTVKSYTDDGRASVRTSEVLEIGHDVLDASLFEPPADYTKYKPKKKSLASRALSLFGKG